MSLPTVESLMIPLLQFANDGQEHTLREAISVLAERLCLAEEDRRALLPSGRQTKFEKRVGWARMHVTKAGFLESTGRGRFVITKAGVEMLKGEPKRLTFGFLRNSAGAHTC